MTLADETCPAVVKPELMPPLVLFGPDGKYTAAAEAIFSGT